MTMTFLSMICSTLQPFRHTQACSTVNSIITRRYARWVRRKPVAIVNEHELYECDDTTASEVSQNTCKKSEKLGRRLRKKAKIPAKIDKMDTEKTGKNEEAEKTEKTEKTKILFTKLKENDKILSSTMVKLKSRKNREKSNQMVLEGHILINDALKAGLTPTAIFYSNSADIQPFTSLKNVELYKVPYKTIQLWSTLTTSPGLLGIFEIPDVRNIKEAKNALPLTIICDNVREPGNLGTIIRTAAGVGCEKLILMKGCVDLWNPKVLKSACGAHFRIPIHSFSTWDEIPPLLSPDCHTFVTDSNFGDEFIVKYSPEVLQSSLEIFDLDPQVIKSKISITSNDPEIAKSKDKTVMKQQLLRIPIVPYYAIDYTRKESVLIVSGETEGLSYDSCKYVINQNSIRVNIPLTDGIDSLNVGTAIAVITFEIKRQFLKKQSIL